MNSRILRLSKSYRSWFLSFTSPKVSAGYLIYPVGIRDTAKSGIGCLGNRHLQSLAESLSVNVGGSGQNGKGSSLPMSVLSVGGSIVVRGRESRPHGEGSQEFNMLKRKYTEPGESPADCALAVI